MHRLQLLPGLLAVSSLLAVACTSEGDPDVISSRGNLDASAPRADGPVRPNGSTPSGPKDAGPDLGSQGGADASIMEAGSPAPNVPRPEPTIPTSTPSITPDPQPIAPQPEPVTPEPTPEPAATDGPPEGWTCTFNAYADGALCNCGCGVHDPDCEDGSVGACDVCLNGGGCSGGACPGSIAADDNAVCELPEGWTCGGLQYGDGMCHCGCGAPDVDCESASRAACDICHTGCSTESCPGPIDADDNTICTGTPGAWTCETRFFGDGELCHCGCGVFDPDCSSADVDACDSCDFEGSCSPLECPGTINTDNNAFCTRPDLPETWGCSPGSYVDGACDCGCGAIDPDCADDDVSSCERCGCAGNCQVRVDPADTSQCLPPPTGWRCDASQYADGSTCNCGCGVVDADCESADVSSCDFCGYYAGCSVEYDCSDLVPDDNAHCIDDTPPGWTCDPTYYGDRACDCGCGAQDLDCATLSEDDCDFCNNEGSCSTERCPGTIDLENNAICTE